MGLDRLLLSAAPDNAKVRQLVSPALQELSLAPLGLEQGHFPVGERGSERDSRRAAAAPDVDDRAIEAADELEAGQRVVEQDATRLGRVTKRSQPGRRDDGRKPALEEVRRRRDGGR
jgi:hypothetical protein